MNKKEFQKLISKIRADIRTEMNRPRLEYPKAMMTAVQAERHTATVNCGGEWVTWDFAKDLASRIECDERFRKFLKDNNAKVTFEPLMIGGRRTCQLRITY